jgi:hypothetical protein
VAHKDFHGTSLSVPPDNLTAAAVHPFGQVNAAREARIGQLVEKLVF